MSDLSSPVRHDWSLKEIREIHDLPLFELVDREVGRAAMGF